MPLRPFSVTLAAAGFLVAGSLPAAAIEPDAVAKALGAALTKGSNVAATYDAAHADGSNVIIDGLTISRLSSDQTVRFDKVVVEEPTQGGQRRLPKPADHFRGRHVLRRIAGIDRHRVGDRRHRSRPLAGQGRRASAAAFSSTWPR